MYVYLIKNGDLHKIGITGDLGRRMRELKPDRIVWGSRSDGRKMYGKRPAQKHYFLSTTVTASKVL